jgi:hypothetical protein
MAIEVTKEDGDFRRECWRFSVVTSFSDVVTLRLSYYAVEERQSKRHKWKYADRWQSHDERAYASSLTREQVPMTDWVKDRARELVQINVPDLEPKKDGRW